MCEGPQNRQAAGIPDSESGLPSNPCPWPQADSVEARGAALNEAFTFSLFDNVCRSLFERHKLMFSFMLAVKVGARAVWALDPWAPSRLLQQAGCTISTTAPVTLCSLLTRQRRPGLRLCCKQIPQVLQQRGEVDAKDWRFLLAGPAAGVPGRVPCGSSGGAGEQLPNPGAGWMTDKSWGEVLALDALPSFAGLAQHVADNEPHYRALFDSARAHEEPLAEPFASRLSAFQRLLVLRCLRPDKVLAAARRFVGEVLGPRFVEPPPFDLATCFRESGPATPLVFVLSPGESRSCTRHQRQRQFVDGFPPRPGPACLTSMAAGQCLPHAPQPLR